VEALFVGDPSRAFLKLGFMDMVATHAYEWVRRSYVKCKKIAKLLEAFLKKCFLFYFDVMMCVGSLKKRVLECLVHYILHIGIVVRTICI
jgi:hypothetical protein